MPRPIEIWYSYSYMERRNIIIYIAGIMSYKMGLEFFNGSIATLATDRFDKAHTFTKLGAAQGMNTAAQCVGAILIAPLVKNWPTRTVLSAAIIFFALMTALLLIVDAATGGKFKEQGAKSPSYGTWSPNLIFFIWTVSGICYGMVELIRRVIPADIVGGHAGKLRRMDALVHIFYEVAGTAGAFASSSAISRWGNNYSFFLTPIFFTVAAIVWFFIGVLSFNNERAVREELQQSIARIYQFWGVGLGRRNAYLYTQTFHISVALYCHRFLENSLAPAFAKRVLDTSAWSQLIVGGSNLGELFGALAVLILSDVVTTPVPWLRFDALALNIVWVLPYFSRIAQPEVSWAWKVAGCFIPISIGWAAGDVSLAAYIQSALTESKFSHPHVSVLGAVMAFLYSTYIILNAVLSTLLGKVIDSDLKRTGPRITYALTTVGGVHFTVCCVIILLSTFIPKGAFAFNPKAIGTIKGSSPIPSDDKEDEKKKVEKVDETDIDESSDPYTGGYNKGAQIVA